MMDWMHTMKEEVAELKRAQDEEVTIYCIALPVMLYVDSTAVRRLIKTSEWQTQG